MESDDDLDDFSHLPSVDAAPSAEDKKALWKQHSRRAPPRELPPVEDPIPDEPPADPAPPADADDAWVDEALTVRPPERFESSHENEEPRPQPPADPLIPDSDAAGPAVEVQEWVREAFELSSDEPEFKRSKGPELHAAQASAGVADEIDPTKIPDQPKREAEAPRLSKKRGRGAKQGPKAQPGDPSKNTLPSADDLAPAKDEAPRKGAPAPPREPSPPPLPVGAAIEPEPDAKTRFRKTWEKIGGRALAASLAVHIALLVIAAAVIIQTVAEKDVDFLPGGGSKGASEAAQSLKHKVQSKKNTWLKSKQPLKRVVSTSISPDITLPDAPPDMDFPDTSRLIGSKGMAGGGGFGSSGIGKGFGTGLGFGGKISFMGNSGVGRNIIFVVDVSASMSATGDSGTGQQISRMDLLKRELVKSIGRLPPNTQYQVIYFSDFAWPHNEVDSRNLKVFDKYRWNITPEKTGVRIPPFRYLAASGTTVARSIELIKDADNPGGTNWGSGLCMALNGYPKPDVIFFMTDGVKLDADGWVDAVSSFNLRGGKRTVIHTTAMMQPDAAIELDQLAKRNGGNFTIVTAEGFTLTSEEFFKGRQ